MPWDGVAGLLVLREPLRLHAHATIVAAHVCHGLDRHAATAGLAAIGIAALACCPATPHKRSPAATAVTKIARIAAPSGTGFCRPNREPRSYYTSSHESPVG